MEVIRATDSPSESGPQSIIANEIRVIESFQAFVSTAIVRSGSSTQQNTERMRTGSQQPIDDEEVFEDDHATHQREFC